MQKYDDENYVDNILKQDNDANEIQELRKFTVELYDYNEKKLKLFNTTFEDFILNYYDNKSTDKNKLNLILNLLKSSISIIASAIHSFLSTISLLSKNLGNNISNALLGLSRI